MWGYGGKTFLVFLKQIGDSMLDHESSSHHDIQFIFESSPCSRNISTLSRVCHKRLLCFLGSAVTSISEILEMKEQKHFITLEEK
jgi:hypothetical protein